MQQTSFVQGIVSSYQQNLEQNNQQYQSVIWLENLDPNIISGSLIRRSGWVLKDYHLMGNEDSLNDTDNPYRVEGINNASIVSTPSDIEVLSSFEFQNTRPVINTMPINIIAKEDRHFIDNQWCFPSKSYLLSYYPIEVNNALQSQWNEPHDFRNIDDSNGSELVGKVSDYTIYGNVIILVSRKDKHEQIYGQNCYPVYIYAFNDAGFDVKHWLNKDNEIQANTKSQFWDIRKNSSVDVISSALNMVYPRYFDNKLAWYVYDLGKKLYVADGNQNVYINNVFADEYQSVPWYSSYKHTYGVTENVTALSTNCQSLNTHLTDIELVVWQNREAPAEFRDNTYTSNEDFLYTCQALEGVDWYPHQGLYSVLKYENRGSGNVRNDDHGPWCIAPAHMVTYPVKPVMCDFTSATGEKRTINMYLERPFAQAYEPSGFSDMMDTSRPFVPYKDLKKKFGAGGCVPFEEDLINERQQWVKTFRLMLPDYRAKNMPRQFLPGEQIPLVLTAVINGTEVEILRTTYIVQDGNPKQSEEFMNSVVNDRLNNMPKTIRNFKHFTLYQQPEMYSKGYFYEQYKPSELGVGNYTQYQFEWASRDVKGLKPMEVEINNKQYYLGAKGQKALIDKTIDCFNNYTSKELLDDYDAKINEESCCFYNYLAQPEAGYVYFTVRINADKRQDAYNMLPAGLTEFKLYVSQGNSSKGLFKYNDKGQVVAHADSGYSLPIVQDKESDIYRLVKRFIVSSTEGLDEIDYAGFTGSSQGVVNNATNCWGRMSELIDGPFDRNIYDKEGNGLYALPLTYRKSAVYSTDEVSNNGLGSVASLDQYSSIEWTPDFCLWDYPEQSEMLSSNLVTEPWKGKGAGIITNINGISFIGQCQDKDYKDEKAIIRYTELRNNVLLMDVFPETNQLKIGNDYHTALFNYRDQLVVFTKNGFYRVIIQDVTNAATWQVSEYLYGQGVTHIKRVTDTPYGFVFMNDSGVWLSDGSKVDNIADPILNTYKLFASIPHFDSSVLTSLHMVNDHKYLLESDNGDITAYAEIVYNNKTDELHCIFSPSQFGYREYRFIYAFRDKNWRVESSDLWIDLTINAIRYQYDYKSSASHRMHYSSNFGITRSVICNDYVTNDRYWIFRQYMDNSFQEDMLYFPIEVIPDTYDVYRIEKTLKKIYTSLISHVIGDGVNDNYAHQFFFNAIPDDMSSLYTKLGTEMPTEISLIQRVGLYHKLPNVNAEGIFDIIEANNKEGWSQWLIRNSPTEHPPASTKRSNVTRESYKYLFPFGKQFRRSQVYFRSHEIGYIENFSMSYNSKKRRFG